MNYFSQHFKQVVGGDIKAVQKESMNETVSLADPAGLYFFSSFSCCFDLSVAFTIKRVRDDPPANRADDTQK